jgi:hypothetical protein
MQYLIYHNGESFYTNWFDPENNFIDGMIVFDLVNHLCMDDGEGWQTINEDHL